MSLQRRIAGYQTSPDARKGSCQVKFAHALASRRRDDEQGFTLIELMVVVLIIAILIAIAIPTFLGARQRAQDRAAQSDLRNGLTAEKTVYTDGQVYSTDTSTTGLKGVESSLNWGGAITTKPALNVAVGNSSVGTSDIVCLDEKSKSGTTFSIADIAAGNNAGTYFGKVACPAATEGGITGAMTGTW
jgi:type IV pilus assembly protein PilA